MNRKFPFDKNSILLALAGVVALLIGLGNVRVPAGAEYGPPPFQPPFRQPFQQIDVTHTPNQINSLLQMPLQITSGGVMQSGRFPAIDRLGGSLDFLLVQPQGTADAFTKQSAYVASLQDGTLLCSVKKPSETGIVVTGVGDVSFAANSDAFVSFDSRNDILRVRNVDGLGGRIKVRLDKGPLAGKVFAVEPGYEFTVSDRALSKDNLRPADGIMRRGSRLIDGNYAAVAQYYVEGALQKSALVSQMEQKQQSDVKARRILTDMSRMAAVLNQVNGTQGFGH